MSTPNIIAIVCDFDDTLGEDTTNLFLKEKLKMDENSIRKFQAIVLEEKTPKGKIKRKEVGGK